MKKTLFLFSLAGVLSLGCQSPKEDLQIMCDSATSSAVRKATPDKRAETWARIVEEEIGSDEIKALMKELPTLPNSSRCAAIYETAAEVGVEWSCPELCSSLAAFDKEFLDDMETIIVEGVEPTSDGIVVGIKDGAIVSSSGKEVAPVGEPIPEDALPDGEGAQVLQVLGGWDAPASLLGALTEVADAKGYTAIELIGYYSPLKKAVAPERGMTTHATGLGGGYGGAKAGDGLAWLASAVRLVPRGEPYDVQVLISEKGVTFIHKGVVLPPVLDCPKDEQVTICLSNPEASSPTGRHHWHAVYDQAMALLRKRGSNFKTVALFVSSETTLEELSVLAGVLSYQRMEPEGSFSKRRRVFKKPEDFWKSRQQYDLPLAETLIFKAGAPELKDMK